MEPQINTPPNGEITSPNFPEPYPGKKECVWLLNTVNGHRVKVVFDEFEVEPQQDCSYDSVVVSFNFSHEFVKSIQNPERELNV